MSGFSTALQLLEYPFVITYDESSEIKEMYSFLDYIKKELNYSLNIKKKADELLFYNNLSLP